MSRSIVRIALVQLTVVLLGFIALGIVMKLGGYRSELQDIVRWRPLAVFLREYPLLFILLPLAWTSFAWFSERRDSGIFSPQIAYLTGITMACVIASTYLYACVFPFTRPFITGRPAAAAKPTPSAPR